MARSCIKRCVCKDPGKLAFKYQGESYFNEIILTVDEYETIRLIDFENLNQQEAAEQMGVARTTVQAIYEQARRKLASALVLRRDLKVEGGEYYLCDGNNLGCKKRYCHKHMEGLTMILFVTHEKGLIYQHFGHTEEFKRYQIEDGKIVDTKIISSNGEGHGALAGLLAKEKCDALICGGIGSGAVNALARNNITVMAGVSGSCDSAVEAFIKGDLEYSSQSNCDHHDHEEGEGCHCGEHKHEHKHEHNHECHCH